MSRERLIWPACGEDEAPHPEGLRCECGAFLDWCGFGQDYSCDRCGREYNSGGQALAPRSQWGEETGETAADFDRGVSNPGRAFDED
jgi:hypothetical protein